MRETFLNVIDMKRADAQEFDKAERAGKSVAAEKVLTRAWKYFTTLFVGFFCCRFFRPSVVFTFAKVLIAMLFTEMGMVVSAYLYAVARFACGTGSWTLGSLTGWVQEFLNSLALKKRVIQMKYPQWGQHGQGDENETGEVDVEVKGCFDPCISCVCKCPLCKICPCEMCCETCCAISCPLCCAFCDVSLEIFGELFSAIFLVGKALYYTDRMILKGRRESNVEGGSAVENKA